MSNHALVVDDDHEILDDVKDRLESLGHTCDCADCQQAARGFLAERSYSYIVLDLEIPVGYGKPARIQNGRNLLREIRVTRGCEAIPLIVITAHGLDSPDLAVEVLTSDGADFFVRKPFPDKGRTLEKTVRDALTKCIKKVALVKKAPEPVQVIVSPSEPEPFSSGELVFFTDRVELCGVKILGESGLGHSRKMLDHLREKRPDGKFVRIGGEKLAKKIRPAGGINTIAGCAKTIRTNIRERLRKHCNVICSDQDVLMRDEQGYHLNDDNITVRDGTDSDKGDVPGDMKRVPDVPSNVSADAPGYTAGLNERQKWVLAQTGKGQDVTRARLEAVHEVSTKTAKRDLSELVKRGLIEYVRKPHPGFYREKK